MQDIDFPNLNDTLVRALEYPDYARGEFLIKCQVESGWSRNTFISALHNALDYHRILLHISNGRKAKAIKIDKRQITDDGIRAPKTVDLTTDILADMRIAISNATEFGLPARVYSSLEVLTFIEKGLWFIKNEFDLQLGNKSSIFGSHTRKSKDGETVYILFSYYLVYGAPLFDYYRSRNEIRTLLLNSLNPIELKTILKPLYDVSIKIIDLWNTELYQISESKFQTTPVGKNIFEDRYVEFDDTRLDFTYYYDSTIETISKRPFVTFNNRDFAVFASQIASLLAREIIKNEETEIPRIKDFKREIYFSDDKIGVLYEGLKPYFDNLKDLNELLRGKAISSKITFSEDAKKLCSIFNFLIEIDVLLSNKEDSSSWLCRYFKYKFKGSPRDLNGSSVNRYMKMQQVQCPIPTLKTLEASHQ